MKKIVILILLIFSALLMGCKNQKNEANTVNTDNKIESSNVVKKYLDFFNQEGNDVIAVYFKNK